MQHLARYSVFALLWLSACAGDITQRPQLDPSAIHAERALQEQMVQNQSLQPAKVKRGPRPKGEHASSEARLWRVGYPILRANAQLCPKRHAEPGFALALDAHGNMYISMVVEASPAGDAGLPANTQLVAVDDMPVPVNGRQFQAFFDYLFPPLPQEQDQARPIKLTLANGKNYMVGREAVCSYDLAIDEKAKAINAYADGKKMLFSKAILRFAANDNELALIIGHEMAHNALDHINKGQKNLLAGAFAGILGEAVLSGMGVNAQGEVAKLGANIGQLSYSVPFEQEADYVGLYFAARAGYNIDDVAQFWRRMALDNPDAIYTRTTHPTSPERFVALQQTADEIRYKRNMGLALVPELKPQK